MIGARGLRCCVRYEVRDTGHAARVLPLPMRDYARGLLKRLTHRQLVATIYDQLKPTYARYYTRDEAQELLQRAGFADVKSHHRHGYSWLVCGTRR